MSVRIVLRYRSKENIPDTTNVLTRKNYIVLKDEIRFTKPVLPLVLPEKKPPIPEDSITALLWPITVSIVSRLFRVWRLAKTPLILPVI